MSKHDQDNHADQMNPNNDAYWTSRGEDERPDDWQDRVEDDQSARDQKDTQGGSRKD